MTDAPTTSAPAERSFRHTIRRDAGSKVSLDVEVDAERLTRQADRVFERHNQKAKIAGFRPGKAPRAMYERSYGAEHLWAEAAEDLVDQTYREIVELEELSPLEDPKVELTQLEPGKPMKWTATVTVRPEVTLGEVRPRRRESSDGRCKPGCVSPRAGASSRRMSVGSTRADARHSGD